MTKKSTCLKKPEKHTLEVYNWSEIVDWINNVSGRDVRDWSGKFSKKLYDENVPYEDFWHVLCNTCDMHNDSYISVSTDPDDYEKPFAKEIARLLASEFQTNGKDMECWVSW